MNRTCEWTVETVRASVIRNLRVDVCRPALDYVLLDYCGSEPPADNERRLAVTPSDAEPFDRIN